MFKIESRRTVNDPTERLRRLALLFGVFENTPSAAITRQDESAAQGAEANQLLQAGELVNPSTTQQNEQNGGAR